MSSIFTSWFSSTTADNGAANSTSSIPTSPYTPRDPYAAVAAAAQPPTPGANGSDGGTVTSQGAQTADGTAPPRQPLYHLGDQELFRFLVGAWKRNLEWREFGGDCSHLRQTNTIVMIEEHQKLDNEVGARHLKWSFGRTLQRNELRGGYIMKCTNVPKTGEVQLDWQYSGLPCTGKFFPATSVMVLNFFLRTSTVVATYRILDADTMAVCVVEVDEREPSISFGNMYRIDQSMYNAPIYQQGPTSPIS